MKKSRLKRETIDDKMGIVDVKLTTKSGKIIHIEMQILEQDDMPKRITYYNAKIFFTYGSRNRNVCCTDNSDGFQ